MKKNILILTGLLAIIALLMANVNIAIGSNLKSNLEQPIAGSAGYYQVCVTDDCAVNIGFAPYVVTYYGHYTHCINGPGNCSFECPKPCDAM